MKTIKELEAQLLFETKQSNAFRIKRSEAGTKEKKEAWQTLIDLADKSKNQLRTQIETMKKSGLKKPSVKGLKTVCSKVLKATGLKVNGTLKKGFKYATGGKIVKVAPAKKLVANKKQAVKKKTTVKK